MTAFSYQQSNVHQRYDLGRALPADSVHALMQSIGRYAPTDVRLIVDLGCGTGRFTAALAEALGVPVVGVEPAANMRAEAEAKPHPQSVRFLAGSAESIPLADAAADIIFLSQVFHHLPEPTKALREMGRVLRVGGRLCIRQTSRENLDSYFYQRFFPEARKVDEARLPFRSTLIELACACPYRFIARETLRHEVAPSNADYLAKIALRTYSDLEAITNQAFDAGLLAFRDYCAAHPDLPRWAENDLFVFERARVKLQPCSN